MTDGGFRFAGGGAIATVEVGLSNGGSTQLPLIARSASGELALVGHVRWDAQGRLVSAPGYAVIHVRTRLAAAVVRTDLADAATFMRLLDASPWSECHDRAGVARLRAARARLFAEWPGEIAATPP